MSEVLGSLFKYLLALLALVAIALTVDRTFASDKTSTASRQMSDIVTSVRQLYSGQGATSFTGITNTVLINAGVIPVEMTNGDGTTISAPWQNSTVAITAQNANTWMANWTNVPPAACARFARAVSSAIAVSINGTQTNASSPAGVAAACGGASLSTMNFFFSS